MSVEIFALTGLINGIVAIFLSFLVYSRNRNTINKTFTFFILTVALWSIGYWRWLSAETSLDALFWIRIFSVGSILIPPTFFHWVTSLVNKERQYRKYTYLVYVISAIFATVVFRTNLIIKSLEPRLFFDYWPIPGDFYAVYIAIYAIVLYFALSILKKNIETANETEKKRFKIVFWGTIIGFAGGATNFLLWYGIPIPPYGNFLVAVGALTWGYAAAKYNLFNSKVIATEFFAFILWLVFLIKLLLSSSLSDWLLNSGVLLATIIFGILLVRSVNEEIKAKEKVSRLASDLEKANDRLRELDRQKSEFLSFATHQLRSPLTAIKGYTSLILDGSYGNISGKVKEAVDKVFQSTEGMVLMVEDFLNISRIEQGRMKYEIAPNDVNKLVAELVAEMKPTAEKKKLSLDFEDRGKPINSNIDPGKMRQVIANILDNAIKYTPKGFIKVKILEKEDKLLIQISDSGVGIKKEFLPTLFAKFSRAENVNKINVTGTGLGLYLAKMIVEAHGGQVWAESLGEGTGSTFSIELKKA